MKAILVSVAVPARSNAASTQYVLDEGCSDSWVPLLERFHATQSSEQGMRKRTLATMYIPNGCALGMNGTSAHTMITVVNKAPSAHYFASCRKPLSYIAP